MVNNESIVDRVKDYISNSKTIKARGMAEISLRAVVVMDNYDETDVYFDATSYKITHERIWKENDGKCGLFPPALEGTGLGVLSGVSRAPRVLDYTDALQFAKQHLEPIVEEAKWYNTPVNVKIN